MFYMNRSISGGEEIVRSFAYYCKFISERYSESTIYYVRYAFIRQKQAIVHAAGLDHYPKSQHSQQLTRTVALKFP